MNILVTGGAGYIGSVMTRVLLDAGHRVVVADNLSSGHKSVVDPRASFVQVSLGDADAVTDMLSGTRIDAAIHFAGVISMAESMEDPAQYFTTNTHYSLMLFDALIGNGVKNVIFSSTAGVYGNPDVVPIPEDHPTRPTNPYGESKLMVEDILDWYDKLKGLHSVSLRYFNAAGAMRDGSIGEMHRNETHIIPLAIKAIIEKKSFTLFGDDYATPDGTCVRDYIHVEDLCDAHIKALEYLVRGGKTDVFNVGTGQGHSNKEVISAIEHVCGTSLTIIPEHRRPGDAERLVADATKITTMLGWKPNYSDIQTIVETAWKFHTKNENRD